MTCFKAQLANIENQMPLYKNDHFSKKLVLAKRSKHVDSLYCAGEQVEEESKMGYMLVSASVT